MGFIFSISLIIGLLSAADGMGWALLLFAIALYLAAASDSSGARKKDHP